MKKAWIVASIFLLSLFFTACSNNGKNPSSLLSETPSKAYRYPTSSEPIEILPSRYHLKLHDSDLPLPEQQICLAAQKKALFGMSESEIKLLQIP